MGSASLPDAVFFAGGHGGITPTNVFSNTVNIFNANTNTWENMNLSSPRFLVTGISFPDKGLVFFAGGVTNNLQVSETIDVIDFYRKQQYILKLSIPRYQMNVISLPTQGLLFFVSGKTNYTIVSNSFSRLVEIYNFYTNKTEFHYLVSSYILPPTCTSLPSAGYVFIGGNTTFDIYISKNNTWTTYNLERFGYTFSSLDSFNLLFIAGEINTSSNNQEAPYSYDLDVYNVVTGILIKKQLTFSSLFMASASLNSSGLVFFAGGADINFISTDNINIYNAYQDEIFLGKLSTARFFMNAVTLEKYGYVLFAGGINYQSLKIYQTIDVYGTCPPGSSNKTLTIQPKQCSICTPGYFAYQSIVIFVLLEIIVHHMEQMHQYHHWGVF